MTGSELKQARLATGLTQQQLADKTGFHRLAVGYWENKNGKFTARYGAPEAFVKALGMKYFSGPIRARVMGLAVELCLRTYKICGANTRQGIPCQMKPVPRAKRCKFHGGLSRGSKRGAKYAEKSKR